MNLGLPEMIVIFVVALIFFGPKKLPELAKNLGKGIRDFKKAVAGEDEDDKPPPNYAPPTAQLPNTQARVKSTPSEEPEPEKKETT